MASWEKILKMRDGASLAGQLIRLGLSLLFIAGAALYTHLSFDGINFSLVVAAGFGAYMALNIGASDVSNNVGPAVGARAISLFWAIVIAAIFEALGAIVAGGDVVGTIKGGIIDPAQIEDANTFVWLMMAALLAGALWLHLATWMGAPVSTTHSIVGGVLGAGIAAGGWGIANWHTMGVIASSWLTSPLLGGMIAAGLLYAIKRTITYQADVMDAACRRVPVLLGLMGWAFISYLLLKGLKAKLDLGLPTSVLLGLAGGGLILWITRARLAGKNHCPPEQERDRVNQMFGVPLMFAAALLSFAHGSNDVANAIGPLAAIYDTIAHAAISDSAAVPMWILVIGAVGLVIGLALYGPKLIHTVGTEITEMDPLRAYCIAMSAAITVILCSQLGLPVSTTHVTIGAVFGVGFLREYLKANYHRIIQEIKRHHRAQEADLSELEDFLRRFETAALPEKTDMLKRLKEQTKAGEGPMSGKQRKRLRKVHRKHLVKRSIVRRMIAAWIITVPASALMAAFIFYAIRGAMLP
ncbi:inorganic phosphate transporter [Sinimarinibacterium sp. NLF-5-8]|uniref:inorganic phosphate transporter n=1 Tax=Sinimarinibacterium sp. NLF-5-8 TaxID=2698684 RepID=UPI00137C1B0A|nr:inorganic phosphate transporter [Sinimarinibacterium sp. NLF-5-8]QHS09696.1 inorganic phosphate transporter [Sinimarinibacterium sp. NLF-5-8]